MAESSNAVSGSPRSGGLGRGRLWRRAAIWIGLGLLAAALAAPLQLREPYVDGQFYLASLHSLYVDADVDLTNEAEVFPWLQFYSIRQEAALGGLRNPFPIGPALLWAPFYAGYDALARLAGKDGISAQSGPVHAPVYAGTVFWVVIGLLIMADTLRQLGASQREAAALPLVVFAVSPLPAYVFYAPDMGHGCAYASTSLLLWTCLWCRRTARVDGVRWALCGLALGMAFTVRWQDVLMGAIPISLIILARDEDGNRPAAIRVLRGGLWLAGGALLGAMPQLLYWKALYGEWLTIPQGGGFLSLAHAEPLAFLFSTWNGAFLFHPALAILLVGVAMLGRTKEGTSSPPWQGLRAGIFIAVAAQLTSCMLVADWWSGGAFGQRRLISLLPALTLGLYALVQHVRAHDMRRHRAGLGAAIVVLIAWNALGLVRLYDGSLPYNPSDRLWYRSGQVYDHFEYARRFSDIVFGQHGQQAQGPASERGNTTTR